MSQAKTHNLLRHAAAVGRAQTELAQVQRESKVLQTVCSNACKLAECAMHRRHVQDWHVRPLLLLLVCADSILSSC